MSRNEKISVFGLGKLGCSMLSCFAYKGWKVVGMDVNEEFVEKVNKGISPIYEPGVEELIKKTGWALKRAESLNLVSNYKTVADVQRLKDYEAFKQRLDREKILGDLINVYSLL